jgi:succinate dehydrogenase / fumarate reductase iron-sulfur subunit
LMKSKRDGATLTILRFDPAKSTQPHYETYNVKAAEDTTILEALFQILETQDHSLTFRYSCRSAVCGSCAMLINGRYKLACSTLISEIGRNVIIQPLPHMPIIKDLVVDLTTFFEKYKVIKPYVVPIKQPPEREWIQSPKQRDKINDSTDCILCAACYSSCPSVWTGKKYLGPAAILQAYRFAADSRDGIIRERVEVLGSEDGLWRCHTIFNCTEACPKSLNPARFIESLKRTATKETLKARIPFLH